MRSQKPRSHKGAKPRAVSAARGRAGGGQGPQGQGVSSSHEHGAGRERDGETTLGGTHRGGFCTAKRGSSVQVSTLGHSPLTLVATCAQESLGRLLGWGGSTGGDVTPLLLFPGTSEGDKKTEKSPTDDKVAVILTLCPKGPWPWSSTGRGRRDLPAGWPRGCPHPLWGSKPLFPPPPEQEATAGDSWRLPAVSLFCGTLSLQSPGER